MRDMSKSFSRPASAVCRLHEGQNRYACAVAQLLLRVADSRVEWVSLFEEIEGLKSDLRKNGLPSEFGAWLEVQLKRYGQAWRLRRA